MVTKLLSLIALVGAISLGWLFFVGRGGFCIKPVTVESAQALTASMFIKDRGRFGRRFDQSELQSTICTISHDDGAYAGSISGPLVYFYQARFVADCYVKPDGRVYTKSLKS